MTTMTNNSLPQILNSRAKARPGLLSCFFAMQSIHRERRILKEMNADRLADIGVTGPDADVEAKRWVWDAPQHWLS